MKTSVKLIALAAAIAVLPACTRIETGEVGLRRGFDKQVKNEELLPGSFNQTIIGEVLTFPVKEVAVKVEDMTPLARDNSTMKDFDALVTYNINQSQVAEIFNAKNKSFHAVHNGDVLLMYNYIFNASRNAIYKSARKYEALDMADNRQAMETEIKEQIVRTLAEEKLDGTIAKNKSFHAVHNGDVYLMYNYIFNASRNAIYKSARKYEALDMADNRQAMETEIKEQIVRTLAEEKLDGTITISQVLIRNIVPADSVVASANELVKAKNEFKTEEVKVATARKRNESMQANPMAIPLLMAEAQAEAMRQLPGAIANFKGQTLVINGVVTPTVQTNGVK